MEIYIIEYQEIIEKRDTDVSIQAAFQRKYGNEVMVDSEFAKRLLNNNMIIQKNGLVRTFEIIK